MATIFPQLTKSTRSRMTPGERRFAERLKMLLEDDYLVWHEPPVGTMRRYPDFVVLHPSRGLLLLEVKDWKPETIRAIDTKSVELLTAQGLVTKPNPLEQARQYAYNIVNKLKADPALSVPEGQYRGNLICPYGFGVVLTNITRRQFEAMGEEALRETILPGRRLICKDEMTSSTDPEAFQDRLWGMFDHAFGDRLTKPQIDQIRYHLFPEIRVSAPGELFPGDDEETTEETIPDIVRVLDLQQEQLARSLGGGHRVIHGVAGSGKTLILGYRCRQLAQAATKPVLVLCYNIVMASKLRSLLQDRELSGKVEVAHFHGWCAQQLQYYCPDLQFNGDDAWKHRVEAVIDAVDKGWIPRAQYDAVMIDEGQDFAPEWLRLITQMIDPKSDSLLFLYDDAQSIYSRSLGFSLSSVGIKAKGRTTILKVNYRNSREILTFARDFLEQFAGDASSQDKPNALIDPQACGVSGPKPIVRKKRSFDDEAAFAAKCIAKWRKNGIALNDIGVFYAKKWQGRKLIEKLNNDRIPYYWAQQGPSKAKYDARENKVLLTTIHSAKGLEFSRVILIGVGDLGENPDRVEADARLLYVGMTRAREGLVVSASKKTPFVEALLEQPTRAA